MPRIAVKSSAFLPTLFILWLGIHVILFVHYGFRDLVDSGRYQTKAAFLASQGNWQEQGDLFYSVYIGLTALFGKFFNSSLPILIFQSLLSGLAVVSIYRAATKTFNDDLAGFLAGVIFLLWIDNLQWNLVVMTESLACSLMCFTVYAWVHFEKRAKDYLLLALLVALNVLTRPTGMLALAGTIVFIASQQNNERRRVPIIIQSAGILILVGISLAGANAIFSLWDFTEQLSRGNIVTYMDTLQGTPLYVQSLHVNPSTIVPPPQGEGSLLKLLIFITSNPAYILQAGVWKIMYLLVAVRPYYSWIHNGVTLCWMMMVYGLFVRGVKCSGNVAVKRGVYTVIIVNIALIFITTIDWDNRFYVPMEPGIVLFAGGGAATLYRRWKNKMETPAY
ncbi:glycosyltransferase family 39 protein [Chryseolinea lacunae]|uniref:Glycosyltransferase family 39 protein n=1 Tax=Chryseolinea lacunae TaxID=2801331 RepID=A0ABS1KNA6_9BACT|nr:glycosyltransferase family 39 protein [Chryseolinea lacunae]MBL0740921.1 glycosyltransferase family 39 protein [Chryseolinea lacunae]